MSGKRKKTLEFPVEVLREILDYDEDTGTLIWKVRKLESEHWTVRGARRFNSQFAGKPAGFKKPVKNRDYVRMEMKLPGGKNYLVHRVIWAWKMGKWPENMIDHKDQNPMNNRFDNLREADNYTNQQNATLRKDNTSGVSGVSWFAREQRWKVDSQFNRERFLSLHDCFLEAVAERFRHLREFGYSENHGRSRDETRRL